MHDVYFSMKEIHDRYDEKNKLICNKCGIRSCKFCMTLAAEEMMGCKIGKSKFKTTNNKIYCPNCQKINDNR